MAKIDYPLNIAIIGTKDVAYILNLQNKLCK